MGSAQDFGRMNADITSARAMAVRGMWCVVRDGGGPRGMRVAYAAQSEESARRHYERIAPKMRQGCVLLLDPAGIVHAYNSEPMCRRRW